MSERIQGVLAPVVTPFKSDLSPDAQRLVEHCRWLISQNCGLAVFGTNSEGNSLAAEERSMLLDALVAAGVDPSRMMPGTGCCSITETVKLTAQAVKLGCAGVLMLPPFYYKSVTEEGLYRYFSEVVQRVGDAKLRIYLYHIPPVAMVGITTGLVERLLNAYPNAIAGMKDSSGDWNNTKAFLDAFGASRHETSAKSQIPSSKSQGNSNLLATASSSAGEQNSKTEQRVETASAASHFDVFVGSESFLLANMRNGGVGTISATANVNPGEICALYAQLRQRTTDHGQRTADDAELERLQAKLNVVRGIFAKYPMIAALKQGIAIYANDPAWRTVRPPLVELTAEQAQTLAAELKGISFAMAGR